MLGPTHFAGRVGRSDAAPAFKQHSLGGSNGASDAMILG